MEIDVVWLLKNGRYLHSRHAFLSTQLDMVKIAAPSRQDIIDQITFHQALEHRQGRFCPSQSKTEYAATNLDELHQKETQMHNELVSRWGDELKLIEYLLEVREAILMCLTDEERMLVKRHYEEETSLAVLADSSLVCDGQPKSQSTLKRLLKRIQRKAEEVVLGIDICYSHE